MRSLPLASLLLEHGASVTLARPVVGDTPLHKAAGYGLSEIAALLLRHQADVRAKDNIGFTPLHYASQEGHVDIARLLLGIGASWDDRQLQGAAPIHLAAQRNHTEVVRLLVTEAGCPVDLVSWHHHHHHCNNDIMMVIFTEGLWSPGPDSTDVCCCDWK